MKYGWLPDRPDHRDKLFVSRFRTPRALPPRVDWTPAMPPVYDQGQLGSCTANALCAAMQFLARKPGVIAPMPSRLFLYFNERAIEGSTYSDSGAMLRDGCKTLVTEGVCPENLWPYDLSQFAIAPPQTAYDEAESNTLTAYHRVDNGSLDALLGALTDGPVVGGFSVYESFESARVAKTGVANLPGPTERLVGGHAVLVVGFDQATSRFMVRNSWGEDWGMGGYFTIPFEYFTNPDLAADFWLLRASQPS